jgi:hypothetical protein
MARTRIIVVLTATVSIMQTVSFGGAHANEWAVLTFGTVVWKNQCTWVSGGAWNKVQPQAGAAAIAQCVNWLDDLVQRGGKKGELPCGHIYPIDFATDEPKCFAVAAGIERNVDSCTLRDPRSGYGFNEADAVSDAMFNCEKGWGAKAIAKSFASSAIGLDGSEKP